MERQSLCDETSPARVRRGSRRNSCDNGLYLTIFELAMKISYDPEVDALSITFRETTVTTKHLAEGIAADYDSEGRLAGLEILDAQKRFGGTETMRRVELEGVGT
jgi:uncharacterized protein YuzE